MSKKSKLTGRQVTKSDASGSRIAECRDMPEADQTGKVQPTEVAGENQDAALSQDCEAALAIPMQEGTAAPFQKWPSVSGFNLENASRNQQHFIRAMLIFADCCLQRTPEGIFDVLGRNFDSSGFMAWWLNRIGKGHIVGVLKGKDIIDAIRKVAYELYRELKGEIGRPVARW